MYFLHIVSGVGCKIGFPRGGECLVFVRFLFSQKKGRKTRTELSPVENKPSPLHFPQWFCLFCGTSHRVAIGNLRRPCIDKHIRLGRRGFEGAWLPRDLLCSPYEAIYTKTIATPTPYTLHGIAYNNDGQLTERYLGEEEEVGVASVIGTRSAQKYLKS